MSASPNRRGGDATAGGFDALKARGNRALFLRFALIWLTTALAFATLFACRLVWDPEVGLSALQPLAIFTVAVAAEVAVLTGRTLDCDVRFFAIATMLSGLGMAMQFRMGVFDGAGGGVKVAIPAAFASLPLVFLTFSNGRWHALQKLAAPCYIAALCAMVAVLAFGRRYRGGIFLPGNINPTEVVKPLLAISLAAFLDRFHQAFSRSFLGIPLPRLAPLLLLALLWMPPMVLAFALHDLGLALLLCMMLAIMLAGSTGRYGYLILGAVGIAPAGFLLWHLPGHVHARLAAWLAPFNDPTGAGWQPIQGFSAMFAGGIWGAGLGAGLPVEIPIVSTDFVYAAVAEELGMILCLFVLALYAALAMRGFLAAGRPDTRFGTNLAVGLSAILASQALLNVGGVVGALPLTGIVLPFLSQGGSGFVSMMASVALLASVTSHAPAGGRR